MLRWWHEWCWRCCRGGEGGMGWHRCDRYCKGGDGEWDGTGVIGVRGGEGTRMAPVWQVLQGW